MVVRAASVVALIVAIANSVLVARRPVTEERSHLPREAEAKTLLNAFERHREWAHVPVDDAMVPVFIVKRWLQPPLPHFHMRPARGPVENA